MTQKVEHIPLFMRLRSGVFHERGYNLHAPYDFKKDVYFAIRDAAGRVVEAESAPWVKYHGQNVYIGLSAYADPAKAEMALTIMCAMLSGALSGDARAKGAFAWAWMEMLLKGLGLRSADQRLQLNILANFYGKERALDVLNGRCSPDPLAMVEEALAGPEPIGVELGSL